MSNLVDISILFCFKKNNINKLITYITTQETETRVPNADDVAECVLSACKRVTVLIQVALAGWYLTFY